MTSPIEVRNKALEIAKACRELQAMLDQDPELDVLEPWNQIEEPGDMMFNELADEIEYQMNKKV